MIVGKQNHENCSSDEDSEKDSRKYPRGQGCQQLHIPLVDDFLYEDFNRLFEDWLNVVNTSTSTF